MKNIKVKILRFGLAGGRRSFPVKPKRKQVQAPQAKPVVPTKHVLGPIARRRLVISIPSIAQEDILIEKNEKEITLRRKEAFDRALRKTNVFVSYMEAFEQSYVRYGLSLGAIGELVSLPIISPGHENKQLVQAAAIRTRITTRIAGSAELFSGYVALQDTQYAKSYPATSPLKKIQKRVVVAQKILQRMQAADKFVGSAPGGKYYPSDFPQVIDYWGYQKDLDGTHRRMILHYLGIAEAPTLVVRAADLSPSDLPKGYLRDNWQWFANEFRYRAGLQYTKEEAAVELEALGTWYQCIDVGTGRIIHTEASQHISGRTEDLLPFIYERLSEDDVVVDIGCNSGLYTILCGARCRRAIGVEVASRYLRQAVWVQRQWAIENRRQLGNIKFICASITDRLDLLKNCTFLLIPKIFHHKKFEHRQIDKFMSAVKKAPIKTVLIQGHKQRGVRGRQAFLIQTLKRFGFTTKLLLDESENDFPIVIGTR